MAGEVVFVDFDEGVKRVGDNKKLYVKLLAKFKIDAKAYMDVLAAALAAGDMEKAQNQAHTIKGMAANLSIKELFKQILELETQIKARAVNPLQTEAVHAVFAATITEVDKVIAQHG